MKVAFDVKNRLLQSSLEYSKSKGVNTAICAVCADEVIHVRPRLQTPYFRHKTSKENADECELRCEAEFKGRIHLNELGHFEKTELYSLINAVEFDCIIFMQQQKLLDFKIGDVEAETENVDLWFNRITKEISTITKKNPSFKNDLIFIFLSSQTNQI